MHENVVKIIASHVAYILEKSFYCITVNSSLIRFYLIAKIGQILVVLDPVFHVKVYRHLHSVHSVLLMSVYRPLAYLLCHGFALLTRIFEIVDLH